MLQAILLSGTLALAQVKLNENVVEVLRDAQATHHEAWSRGRARVRLRISTTGAVRPCIIEGDIVWLYDSFILKPKVADPDEVHFKFRTNLFDQEGNFVARGKDFVITYGARQNALTNRDWAPMRSSIRPTFVLSPRARFSFCCPPNSDPGRPWKDLIGPSPDLPDAFKTAKFTHRQLPNGDIEQTRREEEGHKIVTVFSAKYDLAVVSTIAYDPEGTVFQRVDYTYTKQREPGRSSSGMPRRMPQRQEEGG